MSTEPTEQRTVRNGPYSRPEVVPEKWRAQLDAATPGSIEEVLIIHSIAVEADIESELAVALLNGKPITPSMFRTGESDRLVAEERRLILAQDRADEFVSEGDFDWRNR